MESTVKRRRWSHVPFTRARYRGPRNLFARSYALRAGNTGARGTNGVTRKAFVGMRKNEILNSLSGEIRAWMAVRIECENPISVRTNVSKCFPGRTITRSDDNTRTHIFTTGDGFLFGDLQTDKTDRTRVFDTTVRRQLNFSTISL